MAKKDSETSEAERGAVEVADGPLLDLTDAAVKRMIKLAKKRGFVTYAELNAVLPSEEVNSCLLYTSPSPRDGLLSRMPSSA